MKCWRWALVSPTVFGLFSINLDPFSRRFMFSVRYSSLLLVRAKKTVLARASCVLWPLAKVQLVVPFLALQKSGLKSQRGRLSS
jgi:hypothetical protein